MNPLGAQRAEKRRRLPTAARSFFYQSRAQFRAAVGARHVGFRPRFVNEHDFGGIDQLLRSTPRGALLDHVGTILLAGNQRLFFRDCCSARQAAQIVPRQTSSPSSRFKSACSSRR